MARIGEEYRDMIYRIYVSDVLKAISFNVSNREECMIVDVRFADLAYPDFVKEDTRTADEIIQNIIEKLEG